MKKFRFSLGGLLRLRRANLRGAEALAQRACASRRDAEAVVTAIDEEIDGIRLEALRALEGGAAFERARRVFMLEMMLETRREEAARALAKALTAERETREALIAARREERLLDRVREGRLAAHARTVRRHEQREADDRPIRPAASRRGE